MRQKVEGPDWFAGSGKIGSIFGVGGGGSRDGGEDNTELPGRGHGGETARGDEKVCIGEIGRKGETERGGEIVRGGEEVIGRGES